MKKISFIIPAYNCQDTIIKCVRSILSCSYPNIEIIIIDDCSMDKTLDICHELGKEDSRVKIIHNKNNIGTSATRNVGLEKCSGNFIWFVDSDDSIKRDIINEFVSYATQNPKIDLFCFNHDIIIGTKSKLTKEFKNSDNNIFNGIIYLKKYKSLYLWDKIYSAKLIDDIRFVDGTKNIEDFYFNLNVIPQATSVYTTESSGYNYNCNSQNSTSRNKSLRNLIKLSKDSVLIHELLSNDIKSTKDEKLKKILLNKLNYSIAGHFYSIFRFYNVKYLLHIIQQYKELNLYPVAKTINAKANLLILIINQEWLVKLTYHIHKIFK